MRVGEREREREGREESESESGREGSWLNCKAACIKNCTFDVMPRERECVCMRERERESFVRWHA